MTGRQSVRAILINGDKVLAMHRNKFGKEYYTLVGGGVNLGEDLEAALRRELREETGLEVGAVRLVFVEDDREFYGPQYIYLCEYIGGEPRLHHDSEEAKIMSISRNIYEPVWLPLDDVLTVPFRSYSAAEALMAGVRNGFPERPQELAWKPEAVSQ